MIHPDLEGLDEASKDILKRANVRARNYLNAEAEFLESVLEIDRDRTFLRAGESYLTPFLVKYFALTEDVAGMFVRVARKSKKIPELQAAIAEGRLSVSKAKVIASVITKQNQSEWIEKAATLSKATVEREIARIHPQAAQPEKIKHVGPNRVQITMEISEETLELLRRAQDLASKQKAASLAETLAASVEVYVEKNDPVRKAERSRFAPGRFTPALKIQIKARDGGQCTFKSAQGVRCNSKRWLDVHHVKPRSQGGSDDPSNLTTLCRAHHQALHR